MAVAIAPSIDRHPYYRTQSEERWTPMRDWICSLIVGRALLSLPFTCAAADHSKHPHRKDAGQSRSSASQSPADAEQNVPEVNLLEAMSDGQISVQAEGRG